MYYPVLVNHPAIDCQQYQDIDQQAAHLKSYNQRYQQLKGGKFNGTFLSCRLDEELALYFEFVNCGLLQNLTVPSGYYSIALVLESKVPITFNGRQFSQGSVFLLPPKAEITVSSLLPMNVCLVHIASHLLDGPEESFISNTGTCLVDNIQHNRALYSLIKDFLHTLSLNYFNFDSKTQGQRFKRAMASIVEWNFSNRTTEHYLKRYPKYNTTMKRNLVLTAMDLIDSNLRDDIDIHSIAKQLYVCRRTLEHYFLEYTQLSPAKYIKLVRLNGIRRDILAKESNVGDIASVWGVWHLGRFAKEYYQLFGELPSQTKKNQYDVKPYHSLRSKWQK